MPISPSEASVGISSAGKCCSRSHSRTCGRISVSANARTVRRSSSCSSVSRKSIIHDDIRTTRQIGQPQKGTKATKKTRVCTGQCRPPRGCYDASGGFMRNLRGLLVPCPLALAGLMCVVVTAPARADVTAFVGASTTPANRPVRGFSAGLGLLIVAFEFEYADTTDDPAARVPSLKTGSGNVLLQSPVPFFGVQPYVTTGAGYYTETLGPRTDQGVGYNT